MMFVKIHFHPLLLLLILLAIVTGTFIQLFIILFIVLVHELGHYLAAIYYKWKIDYIMLWVFGGVMKTDESSARSIKEECIVTLAGPFQHLIIFLLLIGLSALQILPESILLQAHYYNGIILLFNLLPIYPLDGGKLLLLIHSSHTSYYVATKRAFYVSMLLCFVMLLMQLIFFPFTMSAFLLCLFLLLENYRALKEHYYSFIRFLISRMNSSIHNRIKHKTVQSETALIDVFKEFQRNCTYQIHVQRNHAPPSIVSEVDCLHVYFTKKQISATMGEVIDINKNE